MYSSDQLLVNLDHFRGIIPMQKMVRSMDYLEVDEISTMCRVIILDTPEGENTSSDTGVEGELPNLHLGK